MGHKTDHKPALYRDVHVSWKIGNDAKDWCKVVAIQAEVCSKGI